MSISVHAAAAQVQQTVELFHNVLSNSVQENVDQNVREIQATTEARLPADPGKGENVNVKV